MRIRQCFVSRCLRGFESRFRDKYKLMEKYTDLSKPVLFFGCYTIHTAKAILSHQGVVVLVWAGTDGEILRKVFENKNPDPETLEIYKKLLGKKNVHHIAISKDLQEDLSFCKAKFIYIPVNPVIIPLFSSKVPLGKFVYVYNCNRKPVVYNKNLVLEAKKRLPGIQFLIGEVGGKNELQYDRMSELYSNCFIGLRLTKHDGLPNTVIELGLMGRKCIFNGELPNSIPWKSSEDIVESILLERNKKDSLIEREKLSNEMLRFLETREDWLDTKYYDC